MVLRHRRWYTDVVPMDRVVAYAAAFDPGFVARLRGAESAEIARLERVLGRPLAHEHRAFLERMGHGDGGLGVAHEGSADIGDVIDWYEAMGSRAAPPDCALLVVGTASTEPVALHAGGGSTSVVFLDPVGGEHATYAASLEGLLLRLAFFRRMRRMGRSFGIWAASLGDVGGRILVPDARAIVERHALALAPFSDAVVVCAEGEGVAIAAGQLPFGGPWVRIAAASRAAAQRLAAPFVAELGVSFDCWVDER